MEKTKAIMLLIAALVLVAALAGIAFAQYVGSQTNGASNSLSQTQSISGNTYPYGQQGNYAYGLTQSGYSYGFRMGMCGRYS